jgi:hypothetical protein
MPVWYQHRQFWICGDIFNKKYTTVGLNAMLIIEYEIIDLIVGIPLIIDIISGYSQEPEYFKTWGTQTQISAEPISIHHTNYLIYLK